MTTATFREVEERGKRLEALRAHLDEGACQAKRGDFVEFSIGDIIGRAKKRIAKK
jgi:antitoxin ParD1/3/4